MITGEMEVNSFALIHSILEAKFGDDPLAKFSLTISCECSDLFQCYPVFYSIRNTEKHWYKSELWHKITC